MGSPQKTEPPSLALFWLTKRGGWLGCITADALTWQNMGLGLKWCEGAIEQRARGWADKSPKIENRALVAWFLLTTSKEASSWVVGSYLGVGLLVNCRTREVAWWCLPYPCPSPSFPPLSLLPSILPIPSYKSLGVLGIGHACLHQVVVEG